MHSTLKAPEPTGLQGLNALIIKNPLTIRWLSITKAINFYMRNWYW